MSVKSEWMSVLDVDVRKFKQTLNMAVGCECMVHWCSEGGHCSANWTNETEKQKNPATDWLVSGPAHTVSKMHQAHALSEMQDRKGNGTDMFQQLV